jgi:hypothetical protein
VWRSVRAIHLRWSWRALGLAPLLLCACGEERIVPADAPITVHPGHLDFADVEVDHPARLRLQLENPGRTPATARIEADPPFQVFPPRVQLAPSSRESVEVLLVASLPGPQHGELHVAGEDTTLTVPLFGVAHIADVETDELLDFDLVHVRSWTRLPLHVRSLSDEPVLLSLDLRDDEHAFVMDTDDLSLSAGQEAVIDVSFAPPQGGPFEALLDLRACPECVPHTVTLRGVGAEYRVAAAQPALDFGAVTPGRTLDLPLDVTNTGDLPLKLGLSAPDGFSVSPASLVLGPGRSSTATVTFAPTLATSYRGEVHVGGGGAPVVLDVPVVGLGGGPDLHVEPGVLDFGLQALGISAIRRAHLVDPAGVGLTVTGVSFQGRGAGAFTLEGAPEVPFEVGAQPLPIAVRFRPSDEGSFDAELVLRTDDADQPLVQVPLTAAALLPPPCDVRVEPTELRFGIVHRGATVVRPVRVVNRGSTRCFLSEVELTPAVGVFDLETPQGSTFLEPAGSLSIGVRFRPVGKVLRSANLRVRLSDPSRPDRQVALSGAGSDLDLAVTPDPLEFGALPRGFRGVRQVDVANRGSSTAWITGLDVLPASTVPVFAPEADPQGAVESGRTVSIPITYLPVTSAGDAATLEVTLAGELAPLRIDLHGRADDAPCGVLCAPPVASCARSLSVRVNHPLDVPGSGWDPAGTPVSCAWSVLRAPRGSRQPATTTAPCSARFTPDLVGDYLLQLEVVDPQLQSTRCQTAVSATAPAHGLWIETTWSRDDDVDLHLLRGDGGDPRRLSSWSGDDDCFYNNPHPDWDRSGLTADDPSLDRDDTTYTGPESLRLDAPVPGRAYPVGLHWFSDTLGLAAMETSTSIYCGGTLASSTAATLQQPGELRFLGTVTFDDADGCKVDLQNVSARR